MELLKPKALKAGDTLGIIATSTPITVSGDETIERAYNRLREHGFKIVEAGNCRKSIGHAAGSIADRAGSLNSFFADPDIDGILAYWGGHQSHQLIEYLDYELIRTHPKPLIGYSDTTALQVGIFQETGLVSFSGPAGITFGKPTVPAFTWDHFDKVLMQPEIPLALLSATEFADNPWYLEPDKKMIFKQNKGWKTFRDGRAEGRITGGNVGTMLLLAGTKRWPEFDGRILFAEEDETGTPNTIDWLFTQLRQLGVFDRIAGLVVGRFSGAVKFTETDTFEMILTDCLKECDFPVITGVDFGHTDPLITIPLGVRCRMDTAEQEISYLEAGVTPSHIHLSTSS